MLVNKYFVSKGALYTLGISNANSHRTSQFLRCLFTAVFVQLLLVLVIFTLTL